MRISKKWKCRIGILVFILAAVLINGVMNYMLYPYTYARVDMHNLETTRYDDIFVGDSHGKCGINPVKVDEATGRKSVNLCMGGQYTVDSYYIVKEACRVNKPKRVIYEVDPGYWMLDISQDTSFGQTFHEMPWSPVKAEYFLAKFMDKDFRNTLFPWYVFRGQLGKIRENMEAKSGSMYRDYGIEYFKSKGQAYEKSGFIRRFRVEGEKRADDSLVLWNQEKLNQDRVLYFDKLIKLCKKEDVELVAITTPVPKETLEKYGEFRAADEFFQDYFQKRGVSYVNFNVDHPGFTLQEDYADWEGHMYGETADRFSAMLGERLRGLE